MLRLVPNPSRNPNPNSSPNPAPNPNPIRLARCLTPTLHLEPNPAQVLLSLVSLRALPPLAWQRTVAVALHAACPLLLLAAILDLGLLLLVRRHTRLQPRGSRQGARLFAPGSRVPPSGWTGRGDDLQRRG